MGRKPTACQKCAAIKAKCTGQVPCARCERLRLPCSLARLAGDGSGSPSSMTEAPHLAAANIASVPVASKARARHSKSTNGCINCRRRRKKCDEMKPTCSDCVRLNLQCLPRADHDMYEPMDISPTPSTSTTGAEPPLSSPLPPPAPALPPGLFPVAPPPMLPPMRCDELSEDSEGDGDVEPILNWTTILTENEVPCSSQASLPHSSALHVLPNRRASDTLPPPEGVTLPPIALAYYAGIDPAAQDSWTTGERHLLNHFLQSVARSLSIVEDKHNPFLRLIVPMVFESKAIRNAVAAMSATHLSKVYPDFVRNQLMHRDMALDNLKAILEVPREAPKALTATLLLCLCEIFEGHSRKWLLYLHGARALLVQFRKEGLEPLVEFMIDLYNYICCMAPVTTPNVPRPFGTRFGLHRPDANGSHALFGHEPGLYESIARVNRILSRASNDHRELPNAAHPRFLAAERELQKWSHLKRANSEHTAASHAIWSATVLRVREVSEPDLDIESPRIQVPVNDIISALSLIRPGSPVEAHLLYPMFMAGVNSVTKASRLVIEYRINVAERTMGGGGVAVVHHMLDELWRRVNNGGTVTGWRKLQDSHMSGCMLI